MTSLLVPARFCGPPRSGNGGWSAGALAALTPWAATTVRLSSPPPLDTDLDVHMEVADDHTTLVASYDGREVLRATEAGTVPTPVAAVGLEEAQAAEAAFPGHTQHPFPTCFGCGTDREPGDGLRVFPGPVRDGLVAATWTPTGPDETTTASTWAALDCPGAWAADISERLVVLGTMTTRLERLPQVGEQHVVVGEVRGREGRKTFTATSLHDAEGDLIGAAEQVWFEVDAEVFV